LARQAKPGVFVVTINRPIRYGLLIETHVGWRPHWHIVKFLGVAIPELIAQRHLRAATDAEGTAMALLIATDWGIDLEPSHGDLAAAMRASIQRRIAAKPTAVTWPGEQGRHACLADPTRRFSVDWTRRRRRCG